MLETILIVVLVVFIYMSLFFFFALFKKNNGLVDIGWGLGFIVISITSMLINSNNINFRTLIPNLLVFLWGLRLAYHILKRNFGKEEDYRYQEMRKNWGKKLI